MSLAIRNHLRKYFATPRALNDYATHIPILIGLSRSRRIRRVLEFGCGHYSTLTFLSRAAFPDLERLHSIENDDSWAATIQESIEDDRWTMQLVNGEIAESVVDLNLEPFDLILIDDSKTSAQRAATIRAVASKQPQNPWVVIHDFEVDEYRDAASGFKYRHRFRAYNPETGVVGNRVADWRTIDRVIRSKAKLLEPDAIEHWVKAFKLR
ncbi:MAG TPA: class I SAM-dependent methyltransferase [Pyrinomonadaceae bacterium]|nr:class I SAM-dependent methyltransferase [Pyrinomonadaceae bacterium]